MNRIKNFFDKLCEYPVDSFTSLDLEEDEKVKKILDEMFSKLTLEEALRGFLKHLADQDKYGGDFIWLNGDPYQDK